MRFLVRLIYGYDPRDVRELVLALNACRASADKLVDIGATNGVPCIETAMPVIDQYTASWRDVREFHERLGGFGPEREAW